MKSVLALLCMGIVVAILPHTSHAQQPSGLPLSVEVRPGTGIPTGGFADPADGFEAEQGFAFAAGAAYHFSEMWSAYAEYARTSFGCVECAIFTNLDDRVIDDGVALGARAEFPGFTEWLAPWVRAGGVLHRLTFSGEGDRLASNLGPGVEAGAGLSFAVYRGLALRPGFHYRFYSTDVTAAGRDPVTVNVSGITLDVGLSYRF